VAQWSKRHHLLSSVAISHPSRREQRFGHQEGPVKAQKVVNVARSIVKICLLSFISVCNCSNVNRNESKDIRSGGGDGDCGLLGGISLAHRSYWRERERCDLFRFGIVFHD